MSEEKLPPASPYRDIDEVFPNVFFVRAGMKMPMRMPIKISRSMTLVRKNGELTIFNSVRVPEAGLKEIEALGKITKVVRLGGFHGRDDLFYKEKYGAKVYAVAGQTYVRGLPSPGKEAPPTYMQPDVWIDEGNTADLPSGIVKVFRTSSPIEGLYILNQEGGIAITADSLQNTAEPNEFVNWFAKVMMKKFGFWKANNVGPGWVQFGKPKADEVRSILQLEFQHLLPGHGEPVIGQAKEKYRPVLEGDLKGCH